MKRRRRNTGKTKYIFAAVLIFALSFSVGFRFIDKIDIFRKTVECVTERKQGTVIEKVSNARLTFTGDIMCHSYQYNEAYNPSTGEYDFSHNFADMKKYFDNADMVIGNLETVFAGEEVGISDYPCFNSPDSFLYAIKDAGFDLVTTANNHCMHKRMSGTI